MFVFVSLNNMISLFYHLVFFILHLCLYLTPGVTWRSSWRQLSKHLSHLLQSCLLFFLCDQCVPEVDNKNTRLAIAV